VEKVARDPAIARILERGVVIEPAAPLVGLAAGFDSLFVENAEGRILAQTPSPDPAVFGRAFQFRDYFQGTAALARTHGGGAYVSRAYRSESEGLIQFALSTPVLDAGGALSGLLAATLDAKAAFGAVRMESTATGGEPITTALLGPRGVDRGDGPEAPTSSRFTVLVHAGVRKGTEYTVATPTPAALRAAFGPAAPPGEQFALEYVPPLILADYRDPVPGFEGRWLAALAPVGKTGYVVLVETRRDRSPWSSLIARAVGLLAIATLALALSLALAARILLDRRRVTRR
jgi:serine/threonine-protein kinase